MFLVLWSGKSVFLKRSTVSDQMFAARGILHHTSSYTLHFIWEYNSNVGSLVFREAMAGVLSVLPCLLSIFVLSFGLGFTCDQIILSKRTDGPPLYQTQQYSVDASGSLLSCSRWCVETDSCEAISWEPSRCIQVDNNENSGAVVNTSVYVVPKAREIPGKRFMIYCTYKFNFQWRCSWIKVEILSKGRHRGVTCGNN